MVAVLKRRGPLRQRSFLELRDEQEALLGSVTSQLELLLPDGRLYGRLVAQKGAPGPRRSHGSRRMSLISAYISVVLEHFASL